MLIVIAYFIGDTETCMVFGYSNYVYYVVVFVLFCGIIFYKLYCSALRSFYVKVQVCGLLAIL